MKHIGRVYIILIVLLCFMHYPLALIAPYGSDLISNVFYFEFPHLFTASILSACFVILNIQSLNLKSRYVQISIGALVFILLSSIINGSTSYAVFRTASFLFIPAGVFLALGQEGNREIIGWGLAAVFVISLICAISF